MALSSEVFQKVERNQADREAKAKAWREQAEQSASKISQQLVEQDERFFEAQEKIESLLPLLESLMAEAKTEGVEIKTSLDADIIEYFSSRVGGFRLGFQQETNSDFEPTYHPIRQYKREKWGKEENIDPETGLYPYVKSKNSNTELYHEAAGLLVILQKDINETRDLKTMEKIGAGLKNLKETIIFGDSASQPITQTEELAERYQQGLSIFPGRLENDTEAWGVSVNSPVHRESGLFGGLYELKDGPGLLGMPRLTLYGSAEEAVRAVREELIEFLARVEELEKRRLEYLAEKA
jgi:hypothetical protein